jgi:hypothetical protein
MKNAIVICLVYFVLVFNAYSQASLGVRGGILYSHLKSPLTSENIIGWEAGIFSKADIGGGAFFQPELDYSEKGGKQFYNDSSFTLRMQYASLRILGGYNFTDWLFAGAGPYFSYLVKSKQDKEFVKPSYFSPLAFGLVFTAGVEIEPVTLALRYDSGLTLITTQSDPEVAGNVLQNSKTRAIQLSAAISF